MLLETFLLLYTLLLEGESKILRIGDNYVARFVLIDSDLRIKSNCIRNITKFTTPQECSSECIKDKNCLSINRHRELGICELLAISKFNETGLLRRDLQWVHFETDDDEKNVGSLCVGLSPCQPYEICEMTFECDPAFKCRCRDGFRGAKCEIYKGPGTEKSNPAASCHLLMLKFKSVPDDEYWFKGQNKKIRCERRVDGGYTKWSSFTPCSFYPCGGSGTQERNRSCTNPSPKGAASSCDILGPNKEVKHCYKECPVCSAKPFVGTEFETSKGKLFTTFSKILKEYKVELELKVDLDKLTKLINTHHSIYHFTIGGNTNKVGTRNPAIWIRALEGNLVYMRLCTTINRNHNHCHQIRKDFSFFKKWVHVELSQTKIGEDYVFRILVNKKEEHRQINSTPSEYDDMKLYLSDPWYPTYVGLIRNMYIEGVCGSE